LFNSMSNLYQYKSRKFGFIVLCPNMNTGHLRNTISSIDIYYPDAKTVVILPSDCNKDDYDAVAKLKKTYKGGKTVSSMLNKGIEHGPSEWHFILFSRGWVRNKIDIKYSYFVENEMDILFPIINRNLTFVSADINGMFINKKSFQDIGDFPDMESLDSSKVIWASKAIKQGYKFKGIVGAKPF
jgi:hypothetical protein